MTGTKHLFAFVIAAIAGGSILIEFIVAWQATGSPLKALIRLSLFFTILTNSAVTVTMILLGLGRKVPSRFLFALVVAIVGTGIVYHLLLAPLQTLTGARAIATQGLHTLSPIFTLLWWIKYADKSQIVGSNVLVAMIWPLVYCGIALSRGGLTGTYPYPFLNLTKLGWPGLLQSIAGLAVGFFAIGLVLYVLARFLRQRAQV